ncbi:hypothetical protein Pla108_08600 [Botrimarina colliarenosi]|uniref:Uncharacterized protein n=1 Tax=Botrimarina colliarenosi TaxID=2528001 RepID=A0A5C6AK88_9BACT|nr:hypothetical protein [Botrimarina colliarenosi]TWT99917.1 hypothetical protein Pla108_08600 [Botrimarina colliarenosi]
MPFTPLAAESSLLAAGWVAAGWMDGIGPLLVVAFWVLRQVMVTIRDQKEAADPENPGREARWDDREALPDDLPRADGPPRAEGRPRAERAPQPAPAAKQADLRSEVEEFLRRATQQHQPGGDPAPPKPRRQPIDPFEEPPQRAPRRQPPPARQQPSKTTPVEAADAEREPRRPRPSDSMTQRSEMRHLPESQLAEQAAHLGESLSQTDERLEERLHQKFDHRLGNIAERPAASAAAEPDSAAARIKKALKRPGGVGEAVILAEILRRPSDR